MNKYTVLCIISLLVFGSCTSLQIKKGSWAKDSNSSTDASKTTSTTKTTTSTTYSTPWRNPAATSVDSVSVTGKRYAQLDTPGGRVLKTADSLVFSKELILGSCGDFVGEVYERAGYPAEKREKLYLEKQTGPFADPGILVPGDWVMYRNLPYGEIGHSAIFVAWIDFEKRSALTIEYVGGNRKVPGRYREADLTKIWGIYRGKDK